jgi:heterodisulfide reductase subunit A
MANIREQDSWVHRGRPQVATQKAKELAAMAVAKARRLRSLQHNTFEIDQRALVIGAGLAGMTAALSIARQGFEVYLVERQPEMGGNLRHIFTAARPGEDPQLLLKNIIQAVRSEPRIQVITQAEVTEVNGYKGQYRSKVKCADDSQLELSHGAIIVATGAREIEPKEYEYNRQARVLTQPW